MTDVLRRPALAGLLALVLFPLARTGAAQVFELPAAFDFKPAGTPSQPGYVAVDQGTLLGAAGDYGFTVAPIDAVVGGKSCDDVVDRDDDDRSLLRGCVRVSKGTEFVCTVAANTDVRVRVLLAHVPNYYKPGTTKYVVAPTALYGLQVQCSEGSALKTVASGIDLRTPVTKGKSTTDVGSWRKLWFTARSDSAGKLRIKFTGSGTSLIPVSAIELRPFVALPIVYKRQGSTWLKSPTGLTIPGLTEFHARNYAGAHAKFLTIADPLTRATALLWLAGWFDGSQEGFVASVAEAQAALADPSLKTNPRAIELRDRVGDWLLGELHFGLRSYSKGFALPPAGAGYFNPDYPGALYASPVGTSPNAARHLYLAENLYYQVSGSQGLQPIIDWNAGTQADPKFEVFPLAFRALDRVARMYYAMSSLHSYKVGSTVVQESLDPITLYEKLWSDFDAGGFRTQEFDGCAELDLMCWVAQPQSHNHSENGGMWTNWDGKDVPSSWLTLSQAWWAPLLLTEVSDPLVVPSWADIERRYLHAYRSGIEWWIANRAQDGEFGGGDGDDPELVALLLGPLHALRQPGDGPERAELAESADRVLDGPNVGDGYYNGFIIDVEHSAEFTSYPLRVALALLPSDPHYLQRCFDVARHLTYASAPAKAWATSDTAGNLRFRSYFFNADGPPAPNDPSFSGNFQDLPYNGKALLPAFDLVEQLPIDPAQSELLSWARGWVDNALVASTSRPLGLVPASIDSQSSSQGSGGNWWVANAGDPSNSFPAAVQSFSYLYSGAFEVGQAAGKSDSWRYLVPIVEILKQLFAMQDQLDLGQTPSGVGTVGTKNWALDQLRKSSYFLEDAARLRGAILSNATLTTQDDPYLTGTAPYVPTTFAADFDDLIEKNAFGYMAYLAKPQGGPNPAAGQYTRKGKIGISADIQRGDLWLKNYFPLATSQALFTDRVFLFSQASHQTLYGMMTGDILGSTVPRPVVTWEAPAAATTPLDVAVLVNDLAFKEGTTHPRLRVLLFNFETTARTIDFRLWNRLPFGKYWMRLGEADSNTDYFKSGSTQTSVDFDRYGARFSVTLPARKQMLLELEHNTSLPALMSYDLALSPAEITTTTTGSALTGYVLHVSAKVFNAGLAVAPAGAIKLFASLVDAAGNPQVIAAPNQTELELPLAANNPSLPPVSGYTIPSAALNYDLPLVPGILALLQGGYRIQFRFATAASADTHPSNDGAAKLIGIEDVF